MTLLGLPPLSKKSREMRRVFGAIHAARGWGDSIDERCHHTGGIYADKRLGVWRFADLPEGLA